MTGEQQKEKGTERTGRKRKGMTGKYIEGKEEKKAKESICSFCKEMGENTHCYLK